MTLDEALKLGIEAQKSGDIEEADRYYTAILGVNPNHPDANHNLGILAVSIHKVEQAIPFFLKAVDTSPGVGQFWLSLIDSLVQLGRYDEAQDLFKKAENNGFSGKAFDDLYGQLMLARKELPESFLAETLKLYNNGEYNEAIKRCSKLVASYQPNHVLYNIRGACYSALGDYQVAIEAYEKAIKLNPRYPDALNNMALASKALGQTDRAIELHKKAISIDPSHADSYNSL